MPPLRRITVAASVAAALLATIMPAAASAAEPSDQLTAPPASAKAIAACGERSEAQRATAHVEREVRGVGRLGGCVADMSGIEHLFLEWASEDGREQGRICIDPPVRRNMWTCRWDTRALEPGSYVVKLLAVDAAGNRGSFDQAYRVLAAEPEAEVAPAPTPEAAPELEPVPDADPIPEPELDITPPVLTPPLDRLVQDTLAECERLELAPGAVADRSLSLAVLDCLGPALDALDPADVSLDEVPTPPAIRIAFADAASLADGVASLPEAIGGVELQLVLAPTTDVDTDPEAPADHDDTGAPGEGAAA